MRLFKFAFTLVADHCRCQRTYLSAIVLFAAFSWSVTASSDEPIEILERVIASRQTLVSGICQIRGTVEVGSADSGSAQYVCDFTQPSYRWLVPARGAFLSTPEFRFTTSYRTQVDQRRLPVRRFGHGELPVSGVLGFDVRTLGFYDTPSGKIWEEGCLDFDILRDTLLRSDQLSVQSEGELKRLDLRLPLKQNGHFRQHFRIWIDAARGFTTARIEEVDPDDDFRALYQSAMDWEKVGDAWVPIAFQQSSDNRSVIDWSFDWSSVNKPITDGLLSKKSLIDPGVAASVYVVPFPSNRAVEVDTIDNRIKKPKRTEALAIEDHPINWSRFMLIMSFFLTLAGLVVVYLGKEKRRDENPS